MKTNYHPRFQAPVVTEPSQLGSLALLRLGTNSLISSSLRPAHHPGAWKMNILQSFMTVNSELWSQMELFSIYTQFIFEQHRIELYMFTYRQIPPTPSGKYSTMWCMVAWSLTVESQRWTMGLEHPVSWLSMVGPGNCPHPRTSRDDYTSLFSNNSFRD